MNDSLVRGIGRQLRDFKVAGKARTAAAPASISVAGGFCVTDIEAYKLNFCWVIKNFDMADKVGLLLESIAFKAGPNDESEWRLQAYPRGTAGSRPGYLALYLRLVSCKATTVMARIKFTIFNARRNEFEDLICKAGLFELNEAWGNATDLMFMDIVDYLVDGDLRIMCIGTVALNNISTSGHSGYHQGTVPRGTLVRDFGSLLNSGEFGDVTLCAAGKELLVYKGILAARSPVFAAMFKHEMQECERNRVVVEDMEYEVLEKMVAYIYTGELQDAEDMAGDLLVAADRYAIGELKAECEDILCCDLTMNNAKDLLVFADTYDARRLKAECIYYIGTHPATEGV